MAKTARGWRDGFANSGFDSMTNDRASKVSTGSNEKGGPLRVRDKLLERLPTTEGRIAAFDKVHRDLAIATEMFEYEGDGGRLGVYLAVHAVYEYFTDRGIPPAALEPLVAITAAIVDAKRGASSPIFEPMRSATGGAPPTPAMQLMHQGYLAVITECCVRHCKSQGMRPYLAPAAIMAASMVNASKWPVTVTATEMREIRERVRQCRNPKSPDKMAFDTQLSSRLAQASPMAWANILISHEWMIFARQ